MNAAESEANSVLIVALPIGSSRSFSAVRRSISLGFVTFTTGVLSNVGRT
ncbi:MAG TPA: hypothetical protein VHZ95_10370 [Polyangiales bacterium]|nr:hypothetical protein [Polyangiales bacterium]